MTADSTEWSCPNTGRTCTAEDCGKECFQGAAEGDAELRDRLAEQMQAKADNDQQRGVHMPVSYYVRSALLHAAANVQTKAEAHGGTQAGRTARMEQMAERIFLALDRWDSDQSEEFMEEVFASLLPDAHDLLRLLIMCEPDRSRIGELEKRVEALEKRKAQRPTTLMSFGSRA